MFWVSYLECKCKNKEDQLSERSTDVILFLPSLRITILQFCGISLFHRLIPQNFYETSQNFYETVKAILRCDWDLREDTRISGSSISKKYVNKAVKYATTERYTAWISWRLELWPSKSSNACSTKELYDNVLNQWEYHVHEFDTHIMFRQLSICRVFPFLSLLLLLLILLHQSFLFLMCLFLRGMNMTSCFLCKTAMKSKQIRTILKDASRDTPKDTWR